MHFITLQGTAARNIILFTAAIFLIQEMRKNRNKYDEFLENYVRFSEYFIGRNMRFFYQSQLYWLLEKGAHRQGLCDRY